MEEKNLVINNFLERDIIEFLDDKILIQKGKSSIITPEALYLRIKKYLHEGNADKAIDTLETSIEKYNVLPQDNPYKQITFNHILEMIELIKKYAQESKDTNKNLERILKLIEKNSDITQELPRTINIFEEINIERAQLKLEKEEEEIKKLEDIKKSIKIKEQELFVILRKKEYKQSIVKYREIKDLFDKFPSKLIEEKQEAYNDLIAYYVQIKKLKEELHKDPSRNHKYISEEEFSTPNANKIINADVIRQKVQAIKNNIHNKQFHEAKTKIIELKEIAHKIPDEHIKNILESKITTINQKIDFAKRIAEHQN